MPADATPAGSAEVVTAAPASAVAPLDVRDERKVSETHFDPFLCTSTLRALRKASTWWLVVMVPLGLGIVMMVAAIEGRLGDFGDIEATHDIQRILTGVVSKDSKSDFPLLRDYASIVIIFAVFATWALVHQQWKIMRSTIPDLAASGALRPRSTPSFTRIHRFARIDRLLKGVPEGRGLNCLITRVNRGLSRVGDLELVLGIISLILVVLLFLGQLKNGLFPSLAPSGLSAASRHSWIANSYKSWWASTTHPAGLIIYIIICFLGIFIITIQVTAGLFAVYLFMGLSAVCELDIDWNNRDGEYGWRAIARLMRTVRWSLTLHALTLTVGLALFGVDTFPWVSTLVIIWIITMPTFTIIPSLLLRRINTAARKDRLDYIDDSRRAAGVRAEDFIAMQPYRSEMAYVNGVRIRTIRAKWIELPALVMFVVLPIVLTIVQLSVSLRNGK